MVKKKSLLLLLICITITIGFLRDYIFVSINEKTGQGASASGDLFYWKWVLTFVFILLYFVLTCLFMYVLFRQKKYVWLGVFVYAVLVGVSCIVGIVGILFFSFENVYPFVRTVLGIAQSPVVMMILISVCYLNEATWKSKN